VVLSVGGAGRQGSGIGWEAEMNGSERGGRRLYRCLLWVGRRAVKGLGGDVPDGNGGSSMRWLWS
jgi:hypothetical protein